VNETDICFKLHKIESHIEQITSENSKIEQENDFLRKKLQEAIREKRIMAEKVEAASKSIRTLIKQLKEEAK
jgi:regulator of replication initiation timing